MFIDLGNLYFCVSKKWPGRRLDLNKLYLFLRERCGDKIVRAVAYGTEQEDEAKGFKGYLRGAGFDPKFKRHYFKEGGDTYRTDWGIGLTLDVVSMVERVDCIMFCTANPEYRPLLEWLKTKGVRAIVCACGISKQLRAEADECVEITENLLLEQEATCELGKPA